MIVIEILNAEQIVEQHRGAITALLGSWAAVDMQGRVEAAIIAKIKEAFEENNIEARLHQVGDLKQTTHTDL